MNNKFVLLALASVFLLLTVIGAQLTVAATVDRTVGISVDDWAEYNVTYSGNTTMPPPEGRTEWTKITVLEVSGTNITFQQIMRFADMHEDTTIFFVDVDTGQGNSSGAFIAANLTEGNLVYTSTPSGGFIPEGATINETIFRTYLGESVEINHWNLTTIETDPETEAMEIITLNAYWYRATGMLAEYSIYQLFQPPEGDATWLKMEAVISDIIPEFPPVLILPLFMIATLTAIWLGKTVWSTKKSIKKPSPCA